MEVGFAVELSWWLREEGATQSDEELWSGRPGSLAVTSSKRDLANLRLPGREGGGCEKGRGLPRLPSELSDWAGLPAGENVKWL